MLGQRALKLSHTLHNCPVLFLCFHFYFRVCHPAYPCCPLEKVGICSSLQSSREHRMTLINFMLLLSPSLICSPSRALPSALASSTMLEPSSSSGMRVSLDQDFLHSDVHSCWLPQISLQAGLQEALPSKPGLLVPGCQRTLLPVPSTYCSVGFVKAEIWA